MIGDKGIMDVRQDKEQICGTCKYHRRDDRGEWICTCVDSDLVGIETEYDYSCMEYEDRWM